jgi:hypothetical protein
MKRLHLRYLLGILAVIALLLLLQVAPVMAAKNRGPVVLPPSSYPYGRSYGEWSNAWWQWAYAIPKSVNPVVDTSGAHCYEGQEGPIWFLAGTFTGGPVTRTCTIPHEKALFFPLVNVESDNIGVNPPLSVQGLRDSLKPFFASTDPNTFSVHIDDASIPNLGKYKAGPDGPVFGFRLPRDNVYQQSPIPAAGFYHPVISGGYYLMLAPLSPGNHTIHFVAGNQDVTYNLTVRR